MNERAIRCQCGQVKIRVTGEPILAAACYCDDCQEAARQIEAKGGGPSVADPDGGTALALVRDDKFAIEQGEDRLVRHKLKPDSPTGRQVASCCNSALYIDFDDGRFWKSTMIDRWNDPRPIVESRLQVQFRDSILPYADNAPRYRKTPPRLFVRILLEMIRMKMGR